MNIPGTRHVFARAHMACRALDIDSSRVRTRASPDITHRLSVDLLPDCRAAIRYMDDSNHVSHEPVGTDGVERIMLGSR
jgi:hypothetical protein